MTKHFDDFLFVPVLNKDVDVDLLNEFSTENTNNIKKMKISNQVYKDSVICPGYKKEKENYFVEEFVPSSVMTVDSKMPGESVTFKQYFRDTYNLNITDSSQNLLRIFFPTC